MRVAAEPRQIFEYLWALKNLTSPPVRRVQAYAWVRFADELPVGDGCRLFGAGASDPESWLEVHRQTVPPPPEPPEAVRGWLAGRYDDEGAEPQVEWEQGVPQPPADGARPAALRERFEDDPERVQAYGEWRARWDAWAEEARHRRRVQELYVELFALRHRFEREGEGIELACGHGLLRWHVGGERIEQPLLVTRLDLLFDAREGVFRLRPADRGAVLETEMLSGLDIPALQDVARLERAFRDAPVDPTDPEESAACCREFVQTLHPEGRYEPEATAAPPRAHPVVDGRAVLFLRPRSAELWKQELRGVLQALDEGLPVPATIRALVAPDGGDAPGPEGGAGGRGAAAGGAHPAVDAGDLLFPLPANLDQREIARRLEVSAGVTVQGPPGTGKSHTIANLVCHLLAQGRRVLVTSHTERALRVLQGRIPEEIRALCVPVLGADQSSLQEIENSIRVIQDRLASLDPDALDREVDDLWERLRAVRREIAAHRLDLRTAAEREHGSLPWEGGDLPRLEAARRVGAGADAHGWLPDALPTDAEPPLSGDELRRAWELSAGIPAADREEALRALPDPAALSRPDEFATLVGQGAALADAAARAEPARAAYGLPETRAAIEELHRLAEPVAREADIFGVPHLRRILGDVLGAAERGAVWTDLIAEMRRALPEMAASAARLAAYDIRLPDSRDRADVARDLDTLSPAVVHGRPGTLFMLTAGRRLRYLLDGPWVDGRGADGPERVAVLQEHIRLLDRRERLSRRWNGLMATVGGAAVRGDDPRLVAALDDQTRELERTVRLGGHLRALRAAAGDLRLPDRFDWTSWEAIAPLAASIALGRASVEHAEWEAGWQLRLEGLAHEGRRSGAARVWQTLAAAAAGRDTQAYQAAMERVDALTGVAAKAAELEGLLARLRPVAPEWSAAIERRVGAPGAFPREWREAWDWSRLNGWLASTEVDVRGIEEALDRALLRERRLIAELVAKSTWGKQIRRVTPAQRRALFAWKNRLTRIGKGTGKHAARHRAEARQEMAEAQGAIPVWIMPIHRVIENIAVTNAPFDVVIVDESSQCDVFSLVALLRAERAVVVGDDEQISPAAVGVDQDEVHALIRRHLPGVPQSSSFDLQTSLYDHAVRIFPGTLMLKEHFRCVPEIIQFSNDLSYDGQIVPLRVPQPGERIDPPVLAKRVAGYCDELTGARNEAEAEAIVTDIRAMLEDPRYAGLTMGVISLVGEQQAALVHERLRAAVGEEVMEERRLLCGDAYAFQGDERDVMFLSMVSAGNVRFGALARRDAKQRFNVAASRARRQSRLYHSVDLGDLHPEDMRYRLLAYYLDPHRTAEPLADALGLCESGFERDVLGAIAAQGYAVRPQVQVGHHRIDLVVEGMHARLAVECDGDHWHGVERWEQDLQRQQVLERAGWTFWRVRASTFYRDRKRALEGLWERLREMGIERG